MRAALTMGGPTAAESFGGLRLSCLTPPKNGTARGPLERALCSMETCLLEYRDLAAVSSESNQTQAPQRAWGRGAGPPFARARCSTGLCLREAEDLARVSSETAKSQTIQASLRLPQSGNLMLSGALSVRNQGPIGGCL